MRLFSDSHSPRIPTTDVSVSVSHAEWYRKVALSRGRTFLNPYDRGWKVNLREFFNVGGPAAEGR